MSSCFFLKVTEHILYLKKVTRKDFKMKISFSRDMNFFINSFVMKSLDTFKTILMPNFLSFDGTKLLIYSSHIKTSYFIFSFQVDVGFLKKLFIDVENTFQERTKNFEI